MNTSNPTPIPRERLANISYFLIWFVYSSVQTALLWHQEFDLDLALQDSLISATFLAISCFVITNALRYYLPSRRHYSYIVIWALVLAASSFSLSRWVLHYLITDPAYLDGVDQSMPLRICFYVLMIAWVATISILWNIQQDHRENQQRKADAERLAREAELYNLRQQLQPHFLFNSLNSIISLIAKQPDRAKDMTFQLSDFLRGTLRKDDQQLIPLKDELEHINLYLEIEKVRFGHRLKTKTSSDETCDKLLLPAMMLQPLVENAIKFALYDSTTSVSITIIVSCDAEGTLLISITNPYDPKRKTTKKGTGFGLRGVRRRLFLLFGRTDLLETSGDGNLYTCHIKIPQI